MKKSIILDHIYNTNSVLDYRNLINNEKLRFFNVIEFLDVENLDFLQSLNELSSTFEIEVSLSKLLTQKQLSIIDESDSCRTRALDFIQERISLLQKAGVTNFAISSPQNVEPSKREKAIEVLIESIIGICHILEKEGCTLSFESFDKDCHKRRLMGATDEFIGMTKIIRQSCTNFFLAWDSAHIFLQEGCCIPSFEQSLPYIRRIHLANVSKDKSKWYYGDSHLPFDNIGEFSKDTMKELYSTIRRIISERRTIPKTDISLAFEIATHPRIDIVSTPIKTMNYIIDYYNCVQPFTDVWDVDSSITNVENDRRKT